MEKPWESVDALLMRLVVGLLAFAAITVLCATAGGLFVGRLTAAACLLSLLAGLAGSVWAARDAPSPNGGNGGEDDVRSWPAIAALALFAVVLLRQFLALAVSDGTAVTQPNPYNYGDLPLHWTYIAYLTQDAKFWPDNPIFAGRRLGYPIGSDLLAAVFVKVGVSLGPLLRVTGLLASAALYLSLRRWAGSLGVAALVLSGGLALDRFEPGALLRADDTELPWKNVLLALFLPQRGFLYALPAGLLLLWSAREKLLSGRSGLQVKVEGLLWGAMPLFHVHTFLVVSLVYGGWGLWARRVRVALPSLAVAIPLATASVWLVTDGFRAARMIWLKPGWMIGDANPVLFLLQNFGLLLPLALAVLVRPPASAARHGRVVIATGLGLFAALFLVVLAPWEWDNTKALVWAVLLMLGPLEGWLRERPRWLRVTLVALLLAPAVPAVLGATINRRALPVFELDEKAAVCEGLRVVPPDARVATAQTFNHPVALCGRAIVAGYGGHLWTHGIQAGPVEDRLRVLMMGWPDWSAKARELGATYVFWGPREEREFEGSARLWERDHEPLWRGPWGALYRLVD